MLIDCVGTIEQICCICSAAFISEHGQHCSHGQRHCTCPGYLLTLLWCLLFW